MTPKEESYIRTYLFNMASLSFWSSRELAERSEILTVAEAVRVTSRTKCPSPSSSRNSNLCVCSLLRTDRSIWHLETNSLIQLVFFPGGMHLINEYHLDQLKIMFSISANFSHNIQTLMPLYLINHLCSIRYQISVYLIITHCHSIYKLAGTSNTLIYSNTEHFLTYTNVVKK